jgi:hypothetical protein
MADEAVANHYQVLEELGRESQPELAQGDTG